MATFVNSYPTLDVSHKLVGSEDGYKTGSSIFINVSLSRDTDEEEEESSAEETVVAPYYPFPKIANWWVVIGSTSGGQKRLCTIKKVTLGRKQLDLKLDFELPKGKHDLRLYVICDSYVGADHDVEIGSIDVAEGESDSEDESDDDSDDDKMQE